MEYIFKKFRSIVCALSGKLGFAAMAALALALAIGANSAAFNTLDVFPLTNSNSLSLLRSKSLRLQSISGIEAQDKADTAEGKEQVKQPDRPQMQMDYADLIRNYTPGNPLDRVSSGAF